MERTIKYKGWYMVLSVLIAIVLWVYVGKVVNPDEAGTVRNLPITFVGSDLLESRGLMISSGSDMKITIRVSGKRNALNALSSDNTSILVDVSSIQEPGQYTLAGQVSFNLPDTISASSLAVTEYYPQNVTFTVTRRAVRTIPVRGTYSVDVADGYQVGSFSFAPETLEVKGEEALVNQIDYALVTVNEDELSSTFNGELPYTFISYTGEAMDPSHFESNAALIRTTLPVFQLKEVELTVNLVPGGGIGADKVDDYVTCEITPKTIMVSGASNDLEPLKEISLGNIELAKILGDDILTFPIPIATELNNVSGITEATVKLGLKGLTTAMLEVENIELIHEPEGYDAVAVTRARQIQIRGTAEAVASVVPSQLRIVADLDNAVATTGTQTIPVRVYLDGKSDVGVVGDYNIVVSITRE